MRFQILPYSVKHEPLAKEFNRRLSAGGARSTFPASHIPEWLPPAEGRRIFQEYFVAVDEAAVRGAYILKHQDFHINGEYTSLANYQLPISEGIVNQEFANVGVLLTADSLRRSPKQFVLGMGGYAERLPRLLKAMRWSICEVPFLFKVLNPSRFLRKITFLRTSFLRGVAMDILAWSGIGWLSIGAVQGAKRKVFGWSEPLVDLSWQKVEAFGREADELCEATRWSYKLVAVRNAATLNVLYPPESARFHKLSVFQASTYLGWVVVLCTSMPNHKQLGSMRVGSIVDGLARPANAGKILSCAERYLRVHGADIIVANHSHAVWGVAFEKLGFLRGPSNFLLAVSPQLGKALGPLDQVIGEVFMMRGDGDGPINL